MAALAPSFAILPRCIGVLFVLAFVWASSVYPFHATPLGPLLLIYGAALLWRPPLWLFAVPVLLAALDLAPWTGWFFLEEVDLVLMLTCAIGYLRASHLVRHARLPPPLMVCLLLMALGSGYACYHAIQPVAALDANAFSNYLSRYNGLRLLKSWIWPLALLPLMLCHTGPALVRVRTHFMPGMLCALGVVALAATWERWAFPGLWDFASDYRTSAPFSSMHTGGAALDGFLALATPLIGLWLTRRAQPHQVCAALVLLTGATYAGLSTFSRGLYLAYACAALLAAGLLLVRARLRATLTLSRVALSLALLCVSSLALAALFVSSGYRGLAALLVLIGAGMFVGGTASVVQLPALLACSALIGAGTLALLTLGNATSAGPLAAPYVLFVGAAAVLLYCVWRVRTPHVWSAACLIAFACMAQATAAIAYHWAGPDGLKGVAPALAMTCIAATFHAIRRPAWPVPRSMAASVLAGLIVLGVAIPVAVSYHAHARFASAAIDLDTRLRHWRQTLQMMDSDLATHAFGMGLGSYPARYFWHNPARDQPASFAYIDEDGRRFLRLASAAYGIGYGEVIRILQRLAIERNSSYLVALDLRRRDVHATLQAAVCERQLLYPQNCVALPFGLRSPVGIWTHMATVVKSGQLDGANWPLSAPTQLEMAVLGEQASIDIDNVSVTALKSGAELVRNGNFSHANDYWFFSSDRHHLPWHVKNLEVYLLFELGWTGLLTFCLMIVISLATLTRRALAGDSAATAYAAAICAFLVVGQFDSLLDVPRLTLLFILFLVATLLLAYPVGSGQER